MGFCVAIYGQFACIGQRATILSVLIFYLVWNRVSLFFIVSFARLTVPWTSGVLLPSYIRSTGIADAFWDYKYILPRQTLWGLWEFEFRPSYIINILLTISPSLLPLLSKFTSSFILGQVFLSLVCSLNEFGYSRVDFYLVIYFHDKVTGEHLLLTGCVCEVYRSWRCFLGLL